MAEIKDTTGVLVVAQDANTRRDYVRRIERTRPAIALAPDATLDPSRYVDCGAAVIALTNDGLAAIVRAVSDLRALALGQNLILINHDLDDDRLRDTIGELEPLHVLQAPAPEAVFQWTLRRAVPPEAGRGARNQHRPARVLLGVSRAIRDMTDEISRVAPSRLSVLVLGETGTGKELVARAIHEQSPRAKHSFVAINCAALPDALLEEEFFGHKRGSFTGAQQDRKGLFEQADKGTLFLDEIAEMSPMLQVKLLRVLESHEVRRIGENISKPVDVRIVSATHRDLEEAIEEGTFRQDLYYRLNAATLYLPPLRRRRVDVPFLAQHFAEEYGREHATQILLGEDYLDALSQRDFPGNVRELRNTVERAIALATPGQPLTLEDLPPDTHGRPAVYAMGTLRDRIAQVEIQAIREAIERFDGNKTRVARALGVSRPGLRKKMKRLGLD